MIRRVHAEDFCQALGLAAELKYERKSSNPGHRFSAAAVAQIARQVTVPGSMIQGFFEHTIFNLLVGNTDNHAKNASLLYRGQGIWLAPLYDVVPVFMDTTVTHQFSFDHGKAQFAEDFDQDALAVLMKDLGFAKSSTKRGLRVVAATVRAIAELAPMIADKSLADGLHAQVESQARNRRCSRNSVQFCKVLQDRIRRGIGYACHLLQVRCRRGGLL